MKLTFECRFCDEGSKPYLLALQVREGECMDKELLLSKAIEQLSKSSIGGEPIKPCVKDIILVGVS